MYVYVYTECYLGARPSAPGGPPAATPCGMCDYIIVLIIVLINTTHMYIYIYSNIIDLVEIYTTYLLHIYICTTYIYIYIRMCGMYIWYGIHSKCLYTYTNHLEYCLHYFN